MEFQAVPDMIATWLLVSSTSPDLEECSLMVRSFTWMEVCTYVPRKGD